MTVSNLDMDDPTLVNRYLADELSDDERATFEAELVRRPERLRELEATARLKVGLTRLRTRGELAPLLQPPRVRRPSTWFALAAALTMFLVGVLLFRVTGTPSQPPLMAATAKSLVVGASYTMPVASVQALFRSRAVTDADAVIEQAESASAVELRVMPTEAQPARYRVVLSRLHEDGAAEKITSVSDLRPAADGFVSVYADASRLEPGRYRLTVAPAAAAGDEGDSYLIRVIPH